MNPDAPITRESFTRQATIRETSERLHREARRQAANLADQVLRAIGEPPCSVAVTALAVTLLSPEIRDALPALWRQIDTARTLARLVAERPALHYAPAPESSPLVHTDCATCGCAWCALDPAPNCPTWEPGPRASGKKEPLRPWPQSSHTAQADPAPPSMTALQARWDRRAAEALVRLEELLPDHLVRAEWLRRHDAEQTSRWRRGEPLVFLPLAVEELAQELEARRAPSCRGPCPCEVDESLPATMPPRWFRQAETVEVAR